MNSDKKKQEATCEIKIDPLTGYRHKLPELVENIIDHCSDQECYTHIDFEPIPSRESVIDIIDRFKEILFPGYFNREKIDPANLKYNLGQSVSILFDLVSEQICRSIRHECLRYNQPCSDCADQGNQITLEMIESIPDIRKIISTDVRATYDGDPASKSYDEIIFSYPGIFATLVYRLAHQLFISAVPLLPRIMTEYAHSLTGIDIHPGAEIGNRFVIDHGTGVVVGETTRIGNNVRIYQGVTLGALSLPKEAGNRLRGKKRHPTIEDDVIIYSGATILGGDTVIGTKSIIGGNVWMTQSVPPDTKVVMEEPRLVYRSNGKSLKQTA